MRKKLHRRSDVGSGKHTKVDKTMPTWQHQLRWTFYGKENKVYDVNAVVPHPDICHVQFTSSSYICKGKSLKRKRLMLNQTVVKEEEDETCYPLLNGMLTQQVRARVRVSYGVRVGWGIR
jgi:hypothetical protein